MPDLSGCAQAREAVSASLDGESADLDAGPVADHLRGCAACREWRTEAQQLRARLSLRSVPTPDVSDRVVQEAPLAHGPGRAWPIERTLLLVLGICQLVVSVPSLLFGPDVAASLHTTHEVGVTDIALAVGVLAAAWQPWRAAGMLPVIVVLGAGLFLTSVLDILDGDVGWVHELPHLLAVADAALLYRLRRRVPPGSTPANGPDTPRLRSVPTNR